MLNNNNHSISSDYHIIDIDDDPSAAEALFKGLASEPRLNIIRFLCGKTRSVNDIASALAMPATTVAMHIRVLEEAGLVHTDLQPANRGRQKMCSRSHFGRFIVNLPCAQPISKEPIQIAMPIGSYTDCQITRTCGLAGVNHMIGEMDNPATFYHPDRIHAQILWFKQGYLEYRFPNIVPQDAQLDSLQFSMEICSEAPNHADDWPSDITLWVNNVEIGTWTSPADFGNDRGTLNPNWWVDWNSQYGLLKMWRIAQNGSFIDGNRVSEVTLADLRLSTNAYIAMRVGIKADAHHIGGINLFGREFGNYPQDIIMRANITEHQ